jgi:hypothetical protein
MDTMNFLSIETKKLLRHVSLVGVLLTFVLLYLGAVSVESTALAITGLVSGGVTAVIAWLSF